MLKAEDWVRYYGTFSPNATDKRVQHIDLEIVVSDAVIRNERNEDVPIYFTDLQFQTGEQVTGWVPKTEELLQSLSHTNDETRFMASNNHHLGRPPRQWELQERLFNIVGRGHQVICIPNYFPEDWDVEILPSGIDLTLYAKEDFDLMRISTAVGNHIPYGEGRMYDAIINDFSADNWIQNYFDTHPLHYRYSREFWINGGIGSAEQPIKIIASTRMASFAGQGIDIKERKTINIGGYPMYVGRNQFMTIPKGSVRFLIEFYKQIPLRRSGAPYDGWLHLADTGIGYWGRAEFKQWTYGRSRI
ncbi:hypothetical protein [Alkaliphilus peptidifermentans]|uniref:Uncharacterized protein n=1 Tax=Alkaliphilus peptidifermentans DSM 18978 TaxID=1120976 RepID=A0A1G5JL33_9FIRM|nr:hypothetical protein [Alkaliphilus peptidifermentans]SCY88631.1 hypothetical protein SAMN03080606_02882 [Alkaliphilus peptidifermentans DSM 18978]